MVRYVGLFLMLGLLVGGRNSFQISISSDSANMGGRIEVKTKEEVKTIEEVGVWSEVNVSQLIKLKSLNRSIDGSNNNKENPSWGKSFTNIRRKTVPNYEDGVSVPIDNMPNARYLSEAVSKLPENKVIQNQFNLTMLFGTWGQFLDHDITLSEEQSDSELQIIRVPRCDEFFDVNCTGKETITYHRSKYDSKQKIRTNMNELTAWVDASMVYGSTEEVMNNLRTFKVGKLKTSAGNLLPINDQGQYYAGDVRATENMGLTCLQVLFLREHNRLCDLIFKSNSTLTDAEIFLAARNYVIGLIQKISYFDYLPNLFGKGHINKYIPNYQGYNPLANPTIFTEFSSTAYRIGHPYVTNKYKLVDNNNKTTKIINLYQLLNASPESLTYFTYSLLLKGLSRTLAKERTLDYVDELRNIPKEIMGRNFDLFAINTDRNRDHGVPDYNSLRVAFGLKRCQSFEEIFDDEEDRLLIEKAYNSVDNIDTYVGVLGERVLEGSMYGELGAKIAGEQFRSIRDGDSFWFQYAFPPEVIKEIKGTTIRDIIYRNSDVTNMAVDAFHCNDCTVD